LGEETKHALTFSIVQKHLPRDNTFDGEIGSPLFESARWWSSPFLDPADGDEKVSISVEMSSVVYTHSSTFLAKLNSCATDFKCCMATLAQSIIAAGPVLRRTSALLPGQAGRTILDIVHVPAPSGDEVHAVAGCQVLCNRSVSQMYKV